MNTHPPIDINDALPSAPQRSGRRRILLLALSAGFIPAFWQHLSEHQATSETHADDFLVVNGWVIPRHLI